MRPVLFLLLPACAGGEPRIVKRDFPPLPAGARAFLDKEATLIASAVLLRLNPSLYEEVKYRVDRNFHSFHETREAGKASMHLENTSGILDQPLRFWVGGLQVVATGSVRAEFVEGEPGIWIEASGEVVWKLEERTLRAERVEVRDGAVKVFERR